MRRFCIIVLLIFCSACAFKTGDSSQRVAIEKNSPVVYIQPATNIYQQASVGVFPFSVPTNFDNAQGGRVAELFKEVLLGRQSFPRIIFIDRGVDSFSSAMQYGREAGVDLVLVGSINHALEGSEFGGARLEAAVRLLNVHTGNTVWYISHSLDQPMDFPKSGTLRNFIAAFNPPSIKPSHGAPAMPNMLAKVAVDTADIIAGSATVQR